MLPEDRRAKLSFAPPELWLSLVFALWAALQLSSAGGAPGLTGDEGWVLLRSRELTDGKLALNGLNAYTSGLHLHLMKVVFDAFGYTANVVRTVAVVLSAIALIFFSSAVHRYWQDWIVTTITAALLFSLPVFAAYGRLAFELTFISPFCLALAAWFAVVAPERGGLRLAAFFLSGLMVGLAGFMHVLALAVPASVVLVLIAAELRRLLRTGPFLAGFVLSIAPRMIAWVNIRSGTVMEANPLDFSARLADLSALPALLAGLWDGPLLYLRFTGLTDSWPDLPVTTALLALAVLARVVALALGDRLRLKEWLPALALVVSILVIAMITPWLAIRYFHLPSFFLPLVIGLLAAPLIWRFSPMLRVVSLVLVLAVSGWHLGGVQYALVAPHQESRNACEVFPLGSRLTESSCGFIDVTSLFIYLLDRGVVNVYTPSFIGNPLEVIDIEFDVLNVASDGPPGRGFGDTAVVVYDAVHAGGVTGPDLRQAQRFDRARRQFDSPEHFIVFID